MAISQQFEAYHEHRVTQELNETRIKNIDSCLKRLAWECDSHRLADLAAEPFTRWFGLQFDRGGDREHFSDHSAVDPPVACMQHVVLKQRLEQTVRVQDVNQQSLGRSTRGVVEWRPDGLSEITSLVAR